MSRVAVREVLLHDTADIIAQVEKVQKARRYHQGVASQIVAQVFQIRVIEIPVQEMMDTLAHQIVAIEEVLIAHHQEVLEAVAIVEEVVVVVVDVVVAIN